MTDKNKNAGQLLFDLAKQIGQNMEASKKAEAVRVAALSPTERAKEEVERIAAERRRVASTEAERRRKLQVKIQKAAASYLSHSSFTVHEFSCLLQVINPGDYTEWVSLMDDSVERVNNTSRVLMSCVRTVPEPIDGLPLYPVNPSDVSNLHRFSKQVLAIVAAQKQLGNFVALAAVLKIDLSIKDVSISQLPTNTIDTTTLVSDSQPIEKKASKTRVAKVRAWKIDAKNFIEQLVKITEARSLEIDVSALPLTWDDLYHHFKQYEGGKVFITLDTFRKEVTKFGYSCVPGLRGPEAMASRKVLLVAATSITNNKSPESL
ncbi:MAG: hypothetical protein AB7F79_06470 [Steroidobacteraceae bacterium]